MLPSSQGMNLSVLHPETTHIYTEEMGDFAGLASLWSEKDENAILESDNFLAATQIWFCDLEGREPASPKRNAPGNNGKVPIRGFYRSSIEGRPHITSLEDRSEAPRSELCIRFPRLLVPVLRAQVSEYRIIEGIGTKEDERIIEAHIKQVELLRQQKRQQERQFAMKPTPFIHHGELSSTNIRPQMPSQTIETRTSPPPRHLPRKARNSSGKTYEHLGTFRDAPEIDYIDLMPAGCVQTGPLWHQIPRGRRNSNSFSAQVDGCTGPHSFLPPTPFIQCSPSHSFAPGSPIPVSSCEHGIASLHRNIYSPLPHTPISAPSSPARSLPTVDSDGTSVEEHSDELPDAKSDEQLGLATDYGVSDVILLSHPGTSASIHFGSPQAHHPIKRLK